MKENPLYYLNPVYIELYTVHPEVKDITEWKNIANVYLQHNEAYNNELGKAADTASVILEYIDTPSKARPYYYSYGEYLKAGGFTWQYYTWYLHIYNTMLYEMKDIKPQVLSALNKLYPYTTQVILNALGKLSYLWNEK